MSAKKRGSNTYNNNNIIRKELVQTTFHGNDD